MGMFLITGMFSFSSSQLRAQPGAYVSLQFFYDELSPYGRWIDMPQYGYVWQPDADMDFRPYSSNGHWAWSSDYDWIWVSDYSWGWAPFHYGRWFYDDWYGWLWVPGYEWSPAWVAWRSGGDYYGWAPLSPGFHISAQVNWNSYNPPSVYWSFAPRRYINYPHIDRYCLPYTRNTVIVQQTTIIQNNNYYYNNGSRRGYTSGPSYEDASRYAARAIRPIRVESTNRPGRTEVRGQELRLYRPVVERSQNNQVAPRQLSRPQPVQSVQDRARFQRNQPGQSTPEAVDRSRPAIDQLERNRQRVYQQPAYRSQPGLPAPERGDRSRPAISQPDRSRQPVYQQPAYRSQPDRAENGRPAQSPAAARQESRPFQQAPAPARSAVPEARRTMPAPANSSRPEAVRPAPRQMQRMESRPAAPERAAAQPSGRPARRG